MNKEVFRPIHYLGNKLKILDFLSEVIDEVDSSKGTVCDLFSGSGSVSKYLSYSRKVISIDIQKYSTVISDAVLNPQKIENIDNIIENIDNSNELKKLLYIFEPLIDYEKQCIDESLFNNSEKLCEFLENGSLIKYLKSENFFASDLLKEALEETRKRLIEKKYLKKYTLISQYFGGIYFSYKQSIYLDSILNFIYNQESEFRNTLLAALLSTSSEIVNTVGNQFAQPIQPRKKDGTPKNNLGKCVLKDRSKNVLNIYQEWLFKYTQVKGDSNQHIVIQDDYLNALNSLINEEIKVIYADPPYTRDHYSRFYHVLETICLNDYPDISTNKINGNIELSRALYRKERHQSPFCIKTQAPLAFENIFKKASEMGASLVLSYSPFDEKGKERPRVMTIEQIKTIGLKYFKNVKEKCPGIFQHSKLNSKEKSFEIKTHGEILIVFTK